MIKQIASELKEHAPFTAFGAVTGIIAIVVIVFGNFLSRISPISQDIFYVLHPTHVFLGALVTTSMYVGFGKRGIWAAVLIGYTGSIGIATLSDSIIPYIGETLLDLPNKGIHIGFIEEPMLTNPTAFLGIAIGYWRPITKFPHAGHVLLSTWASLFHIIMALGQTLSWIQVLAVFLFLFIAVWIPCCVSDIVYPGLFARGSAPVPTLEEGKPT
jgi:hypothetical protein